MLKHLKTFAMLLMVAASMNCFTSCNKDDDDKKSSASNVVLSGTEWYWSHSDLNHMGIVSVSADFNGPMLASMTVTDMSTGIMDTRIYSGSYSCSGNSGTMTLQEDYSSPSFSVPFSVSGNTMSVQFRGSSYDLTKRN